jgi:KDO2-lipid IV(A) lauroyltransferase
MPSIRFFQGRQVQLARQYVGYLFLRAILCVAQSLPIWLCAYAAGWLGWLFSDLLGVRRRVIDENLAHAFPKLSPERRRHLARAMWEHLFLFACETAQISRKIRRINWHRYIRISEADERALVERLLGGRPLVMVTAHFGSFELAGLMFAVCGYKLHSVARTMDNPFLDDYITRSRGAAGLTMLSKQKDYDRILDVLSAKGTVTFLADQYAGHKGCWVDFFGRPASTHKAIGLFSLNHHAPLVVGSCRRLGPPLKYEMRLEGLSDPDSNELHVRSVPELTQWFTRRFEQMICRAPEQYWWLHRRWKDNRPEEKRGRLSVKAA